MGDSAIEPLNPGCTLTAWLFLFKLDSKGYNAYAALEKDERMLETHSALFLLLEQTC